LITGQINAAVSMRFLLSEGSGLTSRQVATRLGQLGHRVEVLSSSKLCLTRFTRHVRKVHIVPKFGGEPLAWFDAANAIAKATAADLLFPTQEQVTVLAARKAELAVATIVPPFAAIMKVQDKISAFRTLQGIGAPQPQSAIIKSGGDIDKVMQFPVFIKLPISTASSGVRRATSARELKNAAQALGLGQRELLVQSQCDGPLAMVQAVADHGRLIAYHANLRIREGAGGGAALKESIAAPRLSGILSDLTMKLGWHGALSMDVILSERGPVIIDLNPRLVEPMNAYLAGVDLISIMLQLAQNQHPDAQPAGRAGVRSRQLLLAILGAAEHRGSRFAVARELIEAIAQRGAYVDAVEELTPVEGDPIAALPVAAAAVLMLIRPAFWRKFHSGAVGSYALTPDGWDKILALRLQRSDKEVAGIDRTFKRN
jgi:glutathione synthase/RimK-type ligase-like ATP-grasp enzyme